MNSMRKNSLWPMPHGPGLLRDRTHGDGGIPVRVLLQSYPANRPRETSVFLTWKPFVRPLYVGMFIGADPRAANFMGGRNPAQ
jgi:hypothetical protein